MYKLDLHTHSSTSPDGGISALQYGRAFDSGLLDYLAVTDHNSVDLASELRLKYPNKIIVGEEIMTTEGEIIGLFIDKVVPAGLSPEETIGQIKAQGGLVYIPHPFETVRSGLSRETLDRIKENVDIIEVHNGRAFFQNRGPDAAVWARLNRVASSASSDAHGYKGLGTTYATISDRPTAKNLVKILVTARLTTDRPPLRTLLYPKANRLRKRIGV